MFVIKDKFKNKVVGFNGSTTPLGERNDLHVLADIGLRSNDPSILELFKKKPTKEEIDKIKGEILIQEFKSKEK